MIISRAPLRISFAGGLTDIADYYENSEYGAVLSTSIDKYVYVTVNKNFENKFRISYSKTEIVDTIEEIEHPIVRECLRLLDIKEGLEITTIGDIPAGTGLGSSSTFTVALLHALHRYKGDKPTKHQLAEEASYIEIDVLKEPIGKQDQYASAFGGLNYIQFHRDFVKVIPIMINEKTRNILDNHLKMYYIGNKKLAKDVLEQQVSTFEEKRYQLDSLRDIAGFMRNVFLRKEFNLYDFGRLLDEQWKMKRTMKGVTNDSIDNLYKYAKDDSALGGKVCGAGGRGFLLLLGDDINRLNRAIEARGYYSTEFNFEDKGSEIIYEQ